MLQCARRTWHPTFSGEVLSEPDPNLCRNLALSVLFIIPSKLAQRKRNRSQWILIDMLQINYFLCAQEQKLSKQIPFSLQFYNLKIFCHDYYYYYVKCSTARIKYDKNTTAKLQAPIKYNTNWATSSPLLEVVCKAQVPLKTPEFVSS